MATLFNRACKFLISAALIVATTIAVAGEPRGMRTNNPGNIVKTTITWQGEVECNDPVNECFESPALGIRAMAIILNNYYNKHQLRTVDAIIHRWGPSGNDAEEVRQNYINLVRTNYVKGTCGASIKEVYVQLIRAIIHFENGYLPFDEDYVRSIVYDTIRTSDDAWECPDWRHAQVVGNESSRKDAGTTAYAESVGSSKQSSEVGTGIFKSKLPMDKALLGYHRSFSDYSVAQGSSLIRTGRNSRMERVHPGIPIHRRKGNGPMENNDRRNAYTVRYSRHGRRDRTLLWKLYGRSQSIEGRHYER